MTAAENKIENIKDDGLRPPMSEVEDTFDDEMLSESYDPENDIVEDEEEEAPISLWKKSGRWATFLIGLVLFCIICRVVWHIFTTHTAAGNVKTGINLLGG